MSKEQENSLAWVFRIVTTALLGAASFLGASIYNKVDEMHWLVKVHESEIKALKEDFKEHKQDTDKENEEKKKEYEKLNSDYAILRENYNDLKRQINRGE